MRPAPESTPRHASRPGPPGASRRRALRVLTHGIPVLVLAGLMAALACGRPDPSEANAIRRSEFIDVVVELREARLDLDARPELADSVVDARYAEERDRILERRGITPGDLYAFVALHPDLAYQTEVWDSITHRLKRPLATAEPDSVAADSQAATPSPEPRSDVIQRLRPDRK